MDQELVRVLSGQPVEAIEWAFRTWRDGSPFVPAICEINELIQSWHRQKRQLEEEDKARLEKLATSAAREREREWKGMEGEAEKRPLETAIDPVEIITPDQPGSVDIPDGLHPNQYATRLLEEIKFPIVPQNIRAVAAAIECEAKAMGLVAAYEFVLECTKFAIFEEHEINSFFFSDGKYRPERRNSSSNGRQVSTQAKRTSATQRNIVNAFAKNARAAVAATFVRRT
jgi:hypothetical protein